MFELTLKHLLLWAPLSNCYQPGVFAGIQGQLLFIAVEYAVSYMAVLLTAYYTWMAYRTRKRPKKDGEAAPGKTEEIAFLRAQLSSHFILNSLNFIYCKVAPHSPKAAGAMMKLSELMRYTIREDKDGCIDLKNEVEYIRSYIHLVQLRYEPDYYVEFEVTGDAANVKLPAMIFIPFVENAMKHGIVHDPANPVKIRLNIQGGALAFTTFNLRTSGAAQPDSGVGIKNVRKRLELLYPGKHTLKIDGSSNIFKVELNIEL